MEMREGPKPDVPISGTEISGFWRRIGAALIDTLLLAGAGFLIGRYFSDELVGLGVLGRIIGFAVTLIYFGVMNSRLGNGQTFGKYLLSIRVIGGNGQAVPLTHAMLRAIIYLLPFYLNGLDLSPLSNSEDMLRAMMVVQAVIVFGGIGSILYLYIFNRRTRQSLHDLAAGTFVVRAQTSTVPVSVSTAPIHFVVTLLWFAAGAAAVPVTYRYIQSPELKEWLGVDFAALQRIQKTVLNVPDIRSSSATVSTLNVFSDTGSQSTYLTVTVYPKRIRVSSEALADDVAVKVLQLYPNILGRQQLSVVVRYGYDIGIGSSWDTQVFSNSADGWRDRLQESLPSNDRVIRSSLAALADMAAAENASKQNRITEAISLVTKALNSGDLSTADRAKAFLLRARLFRSLGRQDAAVSDYTMSIKLKRDNPEAYNGRGTIFDSAEMFQAAISDYLMAIRLKPNMATAHANLGAAYFKQERYDEALREFSLAIEKDPNTTSAYINRSAIYERQGKYYLALADLEAAAKLAPKSATIHFARGSTYAALGELDNAAADLDATLQMNPKFAPAYMVRGGVNFAQARFAAAAKDFENWLALDRTDALAVLALHATRRKLGKDDRDEFARNSEVIDRNQWPGTILRVFSGKSTPKAVLDEVERHDTRDRYNTCQTTFFLGEYELEQGRTGNAIDMFQKAQDICPPVPWERNGAAAELARLRKPVTTE